MTGSKHLHAGARESTPWLSQFQSLLSPELLVLDLGCGMGSDSVELAESGCTVVSLDLDRDRVRQVPDAAGGRRIVGNVVQGLPFQSGAFGCVVSSLSLHYFTTMDTEAAIAEVSRVIARSGWLICRVNAAGDVNFGYGSGDEVEQSVYRQPEGHLKRFFDPPMIDRFLGPYFQIVSITPKTIVQRRMSKRTLECVARKRNT